MKVNIPFPHQIRRVAKRLKAKVRLAFISKGRKAKKINKATKKLLQQTHTPLIDHPLEKNQSSS